MIDNVSFQGKTILFSENEFYKLTNHYRRTLKHGTNAHLTNSRQYFINPTDNSLAVILRGNNNGRVIFVPTGTGEI